MQSYPGINKRILQNFFCDDLLLDLNSQYTKDFYKEYTKQLLKAVPFAYIAGKTFFYDLELIINEDVLIPRFETEVLVDESIKLINQNNFKSIVDIGTGSGAIILNIMKACKLDQAFAIDLSKNALLLCEKNYIKVKNNLKSTNIEFHQLNKLNNFNHKVDFIVSNPPYIKEEADKVGVHFQTHNFEPHMALYLEDSIYDAWFNDLFKQAFNNLNNGGYFFMEGHEDHLENQSKQAKSYFQSAEIIADLTGAPRVLKLGKE